MHKDENYKILQNNRNMEYKKEVYLRKKSYCFVKTMHSIKHPQFKFN